MENPSLNLLKYRPFPELAAALRRRIDHIIDRLQDLVAQTLPTADELTFGQFRDMLPEALRQMAAALESSTPGPTRYFLNDSVEHGARRFHQSFDLRELLVEYSLIRSILVEEVTTALERAMTLDEITALNVGIDAASRRAVCTFVAHMQRELQASTETQSKYLSFLSHDLRGGLNGILLMLEVLKRDLEPHGQFAESVEDLDMMRRSILETVETMDRFLHAERFRKGKVEVKPADFDLSAMLSEMTTQFSHAARVKGLELQSQILPNLKVRTDRELLALILQNLIGNAIKYTRRGSVRILTETIDGVCRISISDDGPGIARDRLDAIFAPFSRGETHGQSGAGLGLSIARQAADLLKIELGVNSELGKGSTFYLDVTPL
ncbi:MAG TPA: sensor histidine kinase [Tepidisphaeraceae bacterium]|nr:sensor histidine kinase [Tepidisphaeraceae bacterium]